MMNCVVSFTTLSSSFTAVSVSQHCHGLLDESSQGKAHIDLRVERRCAFLTDADAAETETLTLVLRMLLRALS